MNQAPILIQAEGPLLWARINRPAKKNALTQEMYNLLTQFLEQAAQDDQVRVALVVGVEGIFTSGNDLGDFLQNPPSGPESPVFRFLQALTRFPKPLLAGVSGPAVGIGTTLLLHCDMVVAAQASHFALPFINLALCPEAASSLLLPALVGRHQAAELLMLGEAFDGAKAKELGLLNRLVEEPAQVEPELKKLALALAAKPPAALRMTKALLAKNQQLVPQVMQEEAVQFVKLLQAPEAKEAMQAFFEKRPADFSKFA